LDLFSFCTYMNWWLWLTFNAGCVKFQVAEGATALYIEQLRGIQYITDRGAQQLSVDIDYLSNVLSALSMPIPAVLATFHSCLSTPRDQLKDFLKTDSANQLDLPTANLVCKMRRVNLDSWLSISTLYPFTYMFLPCGEHSFTSVIHTNWAFLFPGWI
jgi:hypothetical protein